MTMDANPAAGQRTRDFEGSIGTASSTTTTSSTKSGMVARVFGRRCSSLRGTNRQSDSFEHPGSYVAGERAASSLCTRTPRWRFGGTIAMKRRVKLAFGAGLALALVAAFVVYSHLRFPGHDTGRRLRASCSPSAKQPARLLSYLETEAQWACHTIRDYRTVGCRGRAIIPSRSAARSSAPTADRPMCPTVPMFGYFSRSTADGSRAYVKTSPA
jgi:hypothetical protein